MPSKRFTLNKTDLVAWGHRTLQTLAPYLIALIPVVTAHIDPTWKYAVIAVWLLNRVWDLLRRFVNGTPQS